MNCANQELPKHIFFDVGHVLVKPVLGSVVWQIGPRKILRYICKHRKLISRQFLQKRLFDYINHRSQLLTHDSIISCGEKIPQIIYDWITGKIDSQILIDYVYAENPDKYSFFDSRAERDLIFATVNLFKPAIHIGVQREISNMINLLKECVAAYPGRVHILSNWDKSCTLLMSTFSEIFKTISNHDIIFSCNIGYAKPDKAIFDYVAKKFKLTNNQCILIDDMPENIIGIQNWGGHGILYQDTHTTKKRLKALLNEK